MGRVVALFFGLFALLGGAENRWWIDIRPLPEAWLILPGAWLVLHALWPRVRVRGLVAVLIAVTLVNTARYYTLDLRAAPPVPFSLCVTLLLALILKAPRTPYPRLAALATAGLLVCGLPLSQAYWFGNTDYARPADAIVVFGARCYQDGKPSQALQDRMRTACALYHEGFAPRLLLSGGPGDGDTHETECMRTFAMELGVPDSAIDLDRDGLNTRRTVRNTGDVRVLAVSHSWHLPRIKATYRRAGRRAFTVPAQEAYTISQTPYLMAREVAAFWWYLVT